MRYIKRISALAISFLLIPLIILSCFSFPIEFIAFDNNSYQAALRSTEIEEPLRIIFADIAANQMMLIGGKGLPPVLKSQPALTAAFMDYFPDQWTRSMTSILFSEILDFLNFKSQPQKISLDIRQIKNNITEQAVEFSNSYLKTLPACAADVEFPNSKNGIDSDIYQYTQCAPAGDRSSVLLGSLTLFINDYFAGLPDELELSGFIPETITSGTSVFANYSLARWAFRLAPVVAILLLIVNAWLLRDDRRLQWHWNGLLFLISSSILVLLLIALLVGQKAWISFVSENLVDGENVPLLNVVKLLIAGVFPQIASWSGAFGIVIWLIGLILFLAAKYTRKQTNDDRQKAPEKNPTPPHQNKTIQPETLEEVVQKERKNNR